MHAAIAHHPAVVTEELRLIVTDHHRFGDEFVLAVTVIALRFLPDLE